MKKRAARAEARLIRIRELEKQQKEVNCRRSRQRQFLPLLTVWLIFFSESRQKRLQLCRFSQISLVPTWKWSTHFFTVPAYVFTKRRELVPRNINVRLGFAKHDPVRFECPSLVRRQHQHIPCLTPVALFHHGRVTIASWIRRILWGLTVSGFSVIKGAPLNTENAFSGHKIVLQI